MKNDLGTPHERRHLRDPAIGFDLKNPVAGRITNVNQRGEVRAPEQPIEQ